MPVLRKPATDPSLSPLLLEMEERLQSKKSAAPYLVQGVVQIGITDASVKRALFESYQIRNMLLPDPDDPVDQRRHPGRAFPDVADYHPVAKAGRSPGNSLKANLQRTFPQRRPMKSAS